MYVLSLDSELRPQGAARRLTRQRLWIGGVAWTRDGRSIVYGADRARTSGASARTAALLPSAWSWPAAGPLGPVHGRRAGTVSPSSGRLWDPDIYRLQLGASPTPLVESTFADIRRAVLAGRPADRLRVRAGGRRRGDLAGRCRRIESHAADARPGSRPGIARAGRRTDGRSPSTRRPRAAMSTSGRSASTARDCARSRTTLPTTSCRAGRATAASSTSSPTGRVAARSGASPPRAARKSRSRARGAVAPLREPRRSDSLLSAALGQCAPRPTDSGRPGADDPAVRRPR